MSEVVTLTNETVNNKFSPAVKALLWGEFAINFTRGFLLLLFTQQLFRMSGSLWLNLFYIVSESALLFLVPLTIGNLIDRYGVKPFLVCSVFIMGLTLLIGSMVGLNIGPTFQLVLVVSTIFQAVNAAVRVCVVSITPALVDPKKLTTINGWMTAAFQGGHVSGVICSGVLLDHIGFSLSLLITSATALLACYAYANVSRGNTIENSEGFGSNSGVTFWQVLRRVLASPTVIWLIVIGAIDLILIGLFNLSRPPLVAKYLEGSSTALANTGIVFAFGSLFMGLIIGNFKLSITILERWLWLPPILFTFILLEYVYFNLMSYLFLGFCFGASVALLSIYCTSYIQEIVPTNMIGRFSAVRRMTSGTLVSLATWFFASGYSSSLNQAMMFGLVISLTLVLLTVFWSMFYMPARRGKLVFQVFKTS
jgi:MFS family permease